MSDSNYTYLEAAARRKKKNQVISILIIIAVVLVGVAIWGVREHKKSEAAERIKNALNSQAEPPAFVVDSVKPAPPATVETPAEQPLEPVVVEEAPKVAPVKDPAPVKVAKPKEAPVGDQKAKQEAARLAAEEKASAAKAAAEAKAQAAAEAKAKAAEEKKAKAEAARLAAEEKAAAAKASSAEKAAAAKAAAEAKAQAAAEAKAKAAEEKKAKAEAVRLAAEEKAAAAKAAAEAKAQAAAEAKAKAEEEKKAKAEAARLAAEEKAAAAKAAELAKAQAAADAKAKAEAEKAAAAKAAELAKANAATTTPVAKPGDVVKPGTTTPVTTPGTTPAKPVAPEDSPLPTKPTGLSEESRLALTNLPKVPETPTTAAGAGSDAFKQGLNAYRQQDYANANRLFGQLVKPVTKRRGDPVRDEYVQGQFMRGVSLMRTDHTSEAVTAFQNVLEFEKYYPLANMNLGICYVDMKQYAKAHRAFEAVVRDQGYIEPATFDEVMQRTRYFWALAWTRMYKASTDPDKKAYYHQQATLRWKDYQTWFSKNDKYRAENKKADDYLKSLTSL